MAMINSSLPRAVQPSSDTIANPKITAAALLASSDVDKQALRDVLALLEGLYARNKNQHRRNHWFKSLQAFKKQLALLLEELDGPGKVRVKEEKLARRLQWWDEGCVHQWYL